jgi:hypothetical protein
MSISELTKHLVEHADVIRMLENHGAMASTIHVECVKARDTLLTLMARLEAHMGD